MAVHLRTHHWTGPKAPPSREDGATETRWPQLTAPLPAARQALVRGVCQARCDTDTQTKFATAAVIATVAATTPEQWRATGKVCPPSDMHRGTFQSRPPPNCTRGRRIHVHTPDGAGEPRHMQRCHACARRVRVRVACACRAAPHAALSCACAVMRVRVRVACRAATTHKIHVVGANLFIHSQPPGMAGFTIT